MFNIMTILYAFSHRCCHSHTRCRSTLLRPLSLFWGAWRWMTRRWQKLRCRSSKTLGTRWRRVSLTSNRMLLLFIRSQCKLRNTHLITPRSIYWTLTADTTLWDFNNSLCWLFSFLLPQVFYCRYCRPKQRGAPHARPNMPSTASTPCSATETHTLPKSSRSVSLII